MIDFILNKQARLLAAIPLEFQRELYINKLTSKNRLVGLVGARGVGKTTLLLQYIKSNYDLQEALYFSVDDVYLSGSSIYGIVDEFVKYGGKVVVIDEIHKYQNWAIELKSIYDSFPNLLVRFSGSSMLNILEQKHDLSRRAVIAKVEILSFREYLEIKEAISLKSLSLEEVLDNHNKLSTKYALAYPNLYKEFKNYLQFGAYPFFLEDEDEFKNKLFNALEKILREDIPTLNKINYEHISIFQKIISKLIFSKLPYKLNATALAKELNISYATLLYYLDILDRANVISSVKKFSKNISKKPDKLLFANTNILSVFADEFKIETNIGTIREIFFTSCIKNSGMQIYYSDIGDFVVEDYTFEIGGKNKTFKQIKDVKNGFLVIDTDYLSTTNKIPLWLFGLLY
jgi:predicted AAA+ superfamily ATPase